MRLNVFFRLVFLTILATLISCGGNSERTEVEDISIGNGNLTLGAKTVVGVEFSFDDYQVFNSADNIFLSVRLPNGVDFDAGSAEIQGAFGDEDIEPDVRVCDNGQTILIFDLDDNDLDRASDPSGEADAKVNFSVVGEKSVSSANIEASAGKARPIISCSDNFLSQKVEGIKVF